MKNIKNILIVGVGGQGVLLAREILSNTALEAGYDTKKSEVHGMSQRGGVVSSHVRFGEKVFSPLITQGEADIILSFESAEALRWAHFVKSDGIVIVNDYQLIPPLASLKGYEYPKNPLEKVKKRIKHLQSLDALKIANNLGNPRMVNTILLGTLSASLDIPVTVWEAVIRKRVPKGTEELNLKAFAAGREV